MDSIKRSIGSFGHRILLGAMILLAGAIAYPHTSAAKDTIWVPNGSGAVVAFLLTKKPKKGPQDNKPRVLYVPGQTSNDALVAPQCIRVI
jgi:hypothetical protein